MPEGLYMHVMKKKGSTTIAICLAPVVFFFLLNIILKISTNNQEQKQWEQRRDSPEPTWSISCDRSHYDYDLCYINRPSVLYPTTDILFAVDSTNSTPQLSEKIRLYPRKWQNNAVSLVKELTLTTSLLNTSCGVTHSTPARVFSAGGFTSNVFHDFNEGFITVDAFFPDQDVVLAIVNCSDWWLTKYSELIPQFTRHPIVNLDEETSAHCFPSAIVGLILQGPMIVDVTLQRGPRREKTISDFCAVLSITFNQGHSLRPQPKSRPQLVLLRRNGTRKIVNEDEVRREAEEVGFDVVVIEPKRETPMREIFRLLDGSNALVGAHCAGLTHVLFMRSASVFMQVVPLRCAWLADICYGKLSIRLGLEYIVYDIQVHESNLREKLARECLVPHDPRLVMGNLSSWNMYMNQDIKINLGRFKTYLKKAYLKAKKLLHQENLLVKSWSKILNGFPCIFCLKLLEKGEGTKKIVSHHLVY